MPLKILLIFNSPPTTLYLFAVSNATSNRGEGSWKAPSRRRSSRAEASHSFVPRGSMLEVAGGVGATHGTFNDDGSAAAAAAAGAAVAANAAAEAAHVPASWFPPLVQQMESRKNETAQNLIKTQGKVGQTITLRNLATVAKHRDYVNSRAFVWRRSNVALFPGTYYLVNVAPVSPDQCDR